MVYSQYRWTFLLSFRSLLLSLPEEVLVIILSYVSIGELLQSVNRTCKTLRNIIENQHILWRNIIFEHQVTIDNNVLDRLVKHSKQFVIFVIPYSAYKCNATDLDYTLTREFRRSTSLYWMSLADMPLSTLSFLKSTPNLEILNLSGCRNLVNADFLVLKSISSLQQLYVSFTAVTAATLVEIVKGKSIIVLDACGVSFTVATCKSVLESLQNNIISLSISLDSVISESEFRHELRFHSHNCPIHIYRSFQNEQV